MRLFEVEDSFANDLTTLLRDIRGRSDSKNTTSVVPWPAVNNLLKNIGHGNIDSATLANLVKVNPALNSVIKTFDDTGIVLKTKEESPEDSIDIPDGKSVDQMAHNAVKKHLTDIH